MPSAQIMGREKVAPVNASMPFEDGKEPYFQDALLYTVKKTNARGKEEEHRMMQHGYKGCCCPTSKKPRDCTRTCIYQSMCYPLCLCNLPCMAFRKSTMFGMVMDMFAMDTCCGLGYKVDPAGNPVGSMVTYASAAKSVPEQAYASASGIGGKARSGIQRTPGGFVQLPPGR